MPVLGSPTAAGILKAAWSALGITGQLACHHGLRAQRQRWFYCVWQRLALPAI